MLKICPRCKIEKDITEFYLDRRSKDGHNYYCKLCIIEKDNIKTNKMKINLCFCGCGQYTEFKYVKYHCNYDKDVRDKISKSLKEYYKKETRLQRIVYKGYISKDLGHRVRSLWEENICKIFNHLGFSYDYEPVRFVLSNGTTYLPDLYISDLNLYVEIKGKTHGIFDITKPKCFINDKLGNMLIIDEVIYKRWMDTFADELGLQKRRDRKAKLPTGCKAVW